MAVAPPLSTLVSRTLTSNPYLPPRTHGGVAHARTRALIPTPAAACAFRSSSRVRATASGAKPPPPPPLLPPYPLADVFPYITAEWETVAKGWACAAVAVYCLSRAVPAAGRLPRALASGGGGGGGGAAVEVAAKGGVTLAAVASARAAAAYAQQAFLWEAALRAAGRLRERAFERLLERDLAFFEGRGGVATGDIAHRITDEADDVADAVFSVLNDAGKAYNEYKQGQPALERIFDLMRFKPEVTDKPRAIHLQSVNGDIKFHDVTFRYVDGMPPVADGYILLDNHDIQDIQLQCLRTHIAFVSQDTMLFSGTIAENIAYRDPVGDINMNRVEYAAKIANAEEFIKMLPEGYHSNVGQRGSSLSGGQKQRLSIARAIYQNSSILIMDEATSALDIRSELLLKEALSNLITKHSVTVIIIAHRQEMVLMADRIISLERGELREMSKSAFLSQDDRFSSPKIRSPN
uniref:ABC transporter domain-containing protein n=1 Tax=Sorghum bicolor TaxID=4558 RepID=C6JS57_SORBI